MKKIKVFAVIILMNLIFLVFNALAQRSVEDAVEWAEEQIGSMQWHEPPYNFCLKFTSNFYGEGSAGYYDAITAWNSGTETFGSRRTSDNYNIIPKGALVFFEATSANGYSGHVGLYVGGGKMIDAWHVGGVRKINIDNGGNYIGWRWPTAWTNDTNCFDLETQYPSFFQSQGINQCLDVIFNSPDEYIIWHYVYDGMLGYWGTKAVSFNPPNILGWSIIKEDPSITPNPYTQSTDIHINYCEIRPYKEGSWHHEVDVDMAPGQTFFFEIEGRVRNKSNYDLEEVDIDYCFVKDDKDFDVQTRKCLDDDQVDIKEGERETKHSRRSRIVVASDLSQITVYTDSGSSFNLPITQENLIQEEITLYFYLDVETEDNEDRDVSNEAKTDEYAKLEIHLVLPEPPPPELNLSVPFDQEYIRDKTKSVFVDQTIEIPVTINKSGQDALVYYPEASLTLSGPEFQTPQVLVPLSADIFDLNADGKDVLMVQIDPINSPGDYYLNICVDSQDFITETNEDDNCDYIYFMVKKRKSLTPIINLLLQSN